MNYLLASFYLHTGSKEKSFRHLSIALDMDIELFNDFEELFPTNLANRKIKKLLKGTRLI
jgi:hypothetical protein